MKVRGTLNSSLWGLKEERTTHSTGSRVIRESRIKTA
jgi:hypothetical protein